jgi:two-component system nitrate/nitrite response regulator NarP
MADLLIADDHPIFLSGLKSFLEAHGHNVIAHTSSAGETIMMLRTLKPDVVMVDVHMTGGGGLEVLKHVREIGLAVPVIFLTVGIDGEDINEALRLGVNGLVLKNNEPQSLLECIDAMVRGEDWFEDAVIDVLIAHQQRPEPAKSLGAGKIQSLSAREREITERVAQGARNREIATEFGITEGTVKVHLHRIYRKLGIASRGELMLMAMGGRRR